MPVSCYPLQVFLMGLTSESQFFISSSVSVPLQVNYMPDFVIRNQLQIQLIDPICLHYQIFHLLGFFAQFGGPRRVGNIIKAIAVRKVFCYSQTLTYL